MNADLFSAAKKNTFLFGLRDPLAENFQSVPAKLPPNTFRRVAI
jgi:hypothetical protein